MDIAAEILNEDNHRKNQSRPASKRSMERGRRRLVDNPRGRILLARTPNARSPRVVIEITVELVPNGQTVQLQRLRGYWHATKDDHQLTNFPAAVRSLPTVAVVLTGGARGFRK